MTAGMQLPAEAVAAVVMHTCLLRFALGHTAFPAALQQSAAQKQGMIKSGAGQCCVLHRAAQASEHLCPTAGG
jgi:hypothetical protein